MQLPGKQGEAQSRTAGVAGLVGLHAGFALTGAYTALIGAALPVIAAHWRLLDDRSGVLFTAQFLGSMSGALLRGANLLRLVGLGFALVAVACFVLTHAPGWLAPVVLFFYGAGLGAAMTSTSVWTHARLARSGSALESLNAVWAAGAAAVPWAVLPWVSPHGVARFLALASIPAWLCAVWLLIWSRTAGLMAPLTQAAASGARVRPGIAFALALAVLSFGAVGVESAVGGWMTTYVARTGQAGVLSASGAASAFWFGLLGGRVLATVLLLGAISLERLMTVALAVATLAACGLVLAHAPWILLACAAACGLGVGPVYPMVLTVAMRYYRGRWIFVVAGLGAALLPLATGLVSRHTGSLRLGLLLPLGMLLVMAAVRFAGPRWWHMEQPVTPLPTP